MLRKLRKPSFGGDGQQVRVSESQAETRKAMYGVSLQNRASLLEIRSEYEKMYGSIYLTP